MREREKGKRDSGDEGERELRDQIQREEETRHARFDRDDRQRRE